MKTQKTGSSTFLAEPNPRVAQVSKPAVTPISKSANRGFSLSLRAWKPATRQTWKSALQAGPPSGQTAAFTLTELLVVIFTLAILGALLLPALASPQIKDQQLQCLSNLQQLQVAWTSYATDNSDRLAQDLASDSGHYATSGTETGSQPGQSWASWVLGDAGNSDVTLITRGLIYPYVGNWTVYKCPADTRTCSVGAVGTPSLRSYSMNAWMDGVPPWTANITPLPAPQQVDFINLTEINSNIPPAMALVFIEENPATINDGYWLQNLDQPTDWIDSAAHYHNNASCMTFADGHCQSRRWTDSNVLANLANSWFGFPCDPTSGDLAWVQARCTIAK